MGFELRSYQSRALQILYSWVTDNPGKNPCLVLPTGSGKSIIIAQICKDSPKARILMITHTKELIKQNAEKLRALWPKAPLGIYSAGLGQKDIDQITFAGIQSIRNKPEDFKGTDLVMVDECHLISHEETGGYRFFLGTLKDLNPALVVVGLTATPYRLGHGMITDEPALFHDILEPIAIPYLQGAGFLSDLISKAPKIKLSVEGVHKRGGDYIESELQAAVDTDLNNDQAVDEVICRAGDRRSWLFFCSGVDHARHVCEVLKSRGILADCVTGETPKDERDRILDDFKSLKIKALTNANILTTGFDFPGIDLIAMLRPTCSPGLYVQMAGRGLRKKDHIENCLVLDFAGVVEQHGPIQFVRPPSKKGKGEGVAPSKICPKCDEMLHISQMICPECGCVFEKEEKKHVLHQEDIMGRDLVSEMDVIGWEWSDHTSKAGNKSIKVRYFGANLSDGNITEYFSIFHEKDSVKFMAMKSLKKIMVDSGVTEASLEALNNGVSPKRITWRKENNFPRVISREYEGVPF